MTIQTVFFLDVNVIMYAAGKPHPYKNPCIRILSDVEKGHIATVINTEILQELLYRYSRIGIASVPRTISSGMLTRCVGRLYCKYSTKKKGK
jgi:predicted nucleic acid-binding protein